MVTFSHINIDGAVPHHHSLHLLHSLCEPICCVAQICCHHHWYSFAAWIICYLTKFTLCGQICRVLPCCSNLLCCDLFALKHPCWSLVSIGTNLLCGPIYRLTKFTVWSQIHCISLHGSTLLHCDLFALNIDWSATITICCV